MKIVQINSFSSGSTGKIMFNIHSALLNNGYDSYVVWGRGRNSENSHEIYLNDKIGVYIHALLSRITGKVGFYSKKSTKKLLQAFDTIKPDIIHLHNIHGYYINIEMLFNYIKKNGIRVVWTLHDCWSFTGHCSHFESIGCKKWVSKCYKCPQLNSYPKSIFDNTKWCYKKKKELFTGVKYLTIVTPSKWLLDLVKKSYLKNYQTTLINNSINLNVFKPTKSDFREKYNLNNKKILLGVANVWNDKKGLNDFIKLANTLDDNYKIVLIGLKEKQLKKLPKNIIGIKKTENQSELAGLYTCADAFLNLTYEDNYPSVNLEALACGTPVITYNTGGSPECLIYNHGMVVTFDELAKNIDKISNIKKKNIKINNNMIEEYLELYNKKNINKIF